jgi:hypothetical protein
MKMTIAMPTRQYEEKTTQMRLRINESHNINNRSNKGNRQREGKKKGCTGIVHALPLNVCTKDLIAPKRLVGGDEGVVRLTVCSLAG